MITGHFWVLLGPFLAQPSGGYLRASPSESGVVDQLRCWRCDFSPFDGRLLFQRSKRRPRADVSARLRYERVMRERPVRSAIAAVVAVLSLAAAVACERTPAAEQPPPSPVASATGSAQSSASDALLSITPREGSKRTEPRAGNSVNVLGWHDHQRDRDGLG